MDNSQKISIIVPVYNAEKYLEKCLNSLINQTYKNIEILCVNDCSSDNSLNILNEFANADKRIVVINAEKNSGPATARNLGLERATGEYLMFCDNDDTYTPEMCEKMLETMTVNNADLVCCKTSITQDESYIVDKDVLTYYNSIPLGYYSLDCKNISCINIVLWNKIFRMELIRKYGITFPDNLCHEDDLFSYKYFVVAKSYYGLDLSLHNYYAHGESFTSSKLYTKTPKSKRFDRIKVIAKFYSFLVKNNLFESYKELFNEFYKSQIINCARYLKRGEEKIAFNMIKNFIKKDKIPGYLYEYSENYFIKGRLKPYQYIFSVRNRDHHKQITICGLKFKFKRRERCK